MGEEKQEQRGAELTGGGNVVTPGVVADLVDGSDVLVGELDLLEVGGDAVRGDGLGNDGVAANLRPGEAAGQSNVLSVNA